METNVISTFSKNQLSMLSIYNYVKKNNHLIELAENLETYEIMLNKSESKVNEQYSQLELLNEINHKIKDDVEQLFKISVITQLIDGEKNLVVKKTRIYIDGVFDIIHSGHFNALRQAKKLGDWLVLGVNSDEDVEKVKGPTLMNVHERAALASACKWVDEVHLNTPYQATLQLIDELKCDFVAHGDDPCLNAEGEDVYAEFKKLNRYRVFKRTEGVSTTEIIGRLLTLNTGNKKKSSTDGALITSNDLLKQSSTETFFEKGPVVSSFLTTGWRLHEFCNNKTPKENDRIIYIDGSFDILHIGHIDALKKAKELGDFLYVGLHDDHTINEHRGKNYPILNLQERAFNLLALKYVDDVVIGAPWSITEDMIKSLKITYVVHGTHTKFDENYEIKDNFDDPFHLAKKMGIYKEIESQYDIDSEVLVKRLFDKRDFYVKKYMKKTKSEKGYYENKEFVAEI